MSKKQETKDAEKPSSLLTFVIPVRNDARNTLRMLSELRKQIVKENAANALKVVVVDDASDDETLVVLAPLCDEWGFKLLHLENRKGAGGARNEGLKFVKEKFPTEYVAYLDADDFIASSFIHDINEALTTGEHPDCLLWGFATIYKGRRKDLIWIPKFKSHDDWTSAPVAPWIHATKTYMVVDFPEYLLTDDVIWWVSQANALADLKAKFKFIEKPLYIYDKTVGGCTRASEFFSENPMTLEAVACHNVCAEKGFPDRYVSDCLRNLAAMYDLRNELHDERVRAMWNDRFNKECMSIWTGRWGW